EAKPPDRAAPTHEPRRGDRLLGRRRLSPLRGYGVIRTIPGACLRPRPRLRAVGPFGAAIRGTAFLNPRAELCRGMHPGQFLVEQWG
ncbi:MAG: hypothetical protein NTW86_26620, partial [Candidatus Sumerlaeota bacterium]|nr:hypothetical protein [Candidatus Sumerlaeota bacterium]